MKMMKKLLTTLSLSFCLLALHGQYMEVGVLTGAANYQGELQKKAWESEETHLAYGVYARYNVNKFLAVKLQGLYGEVSGNDLNHRAIDEDRMRNLSFSSSILEASLTAEINVFGFDVRGKAGSSFYLYGGVGGFKFNPRAELNGIEYDLQPLGTEGQNENGNRYALISASFPVGIGFKISASPRLNITMDYGLRFTMTDYLDDVSTIYPDVAQLNNIDPIAAALSYRAPEFNESATPNPFGDNRGDATSNDKYMIFSVSLSYNLADKKKLEYDDEYKW